MRRGESEIVARTMVVRFAMFLHLQSYEIKQTAVSAYVDTQ